MEAILVLVAIFFALSLAGTGSSSADRRHHYQPSRYDAPADYFLPGGMARMSDFEAYHQLRRQQERSGILNVLLTLVLMVAGVWYALSNY